MPILLVIDDESSIRLSIKAVFNRTEVTVLGAETAEEGMRLTAEHSPDVILLDIMMPLVDGFEVCRKLKADPATATIPVVMLSAASQSESVKKGLEAGATDYMIKPFEPEKLDEMLERVLK